MAPTLPVLIIGAGPVGLSLAVALQRQGIPFQVYEALDELSHEARASTLHPPTLEMFAEWGVLDEILKRGYPVHSVQFWDRSTWEMVAEFDYRHINRDTAYPFRLQCPQSTVIRVLKANLDACAPGSVHMQHRLLSFCDHGDHVEVELETPHGIRRVEGSYLCAADGSKSTIRRLLNLSFEGITYADRFLLVACDLDVTQIYPELGSVTYLFDPEEWVIMMQLPDVTRIVFQVHDHEDEDEIRKPDAIRARMRRFTGKDLAFTMHSISTYSVHQRVAETFRVGRILLAGDSAHINNPMGGLGMNSGVHDAHCLADKLVRIWHGEPEALLDEYNDVRRGYSLNSVRQRTHQNYEDMAARQEQFRIQRNQRFRDIAADPEKHRAYLLQTSMLESRILASTEK